MPGLSCRLTLTGHRCLWSPQEKNFNVVLDVLTRFRVAEVEKAVKSLNDDQVDVLMKYIYRGFANPTENSCGILLSWHDKVSGCGYRSLYTACLSGCTSHA